MDAQTVEVRERDRSLEGKVRRRLVRLVHRRAAHVELDRPMVSFTFDDALASAAHTGARLLEAAGARGTYYVAADLCGRFGVMGQFMSPEDVGRLAAEGHDIGCHTRSHLDCGQASGRDALVDVRANMLQLVEWGAPRPRSFAWPYGDVRAETKLALCSRFGLMRALHHGLVQTGVDLNQCPAVGIEGPRGARHAQRWVEVAQRRRAWLILYTHDVRRNPSPWGCTPADLEELIAEVKKRGFLVVTVAEGLRRLEPWGRATA